MDLLRKVSAENIKRLNAQLDDGRRAIELIVQKNNELKDQIASLSFEKEELSAQLAASEQSVEHLNDKYRQVLEQKSKLEASRKVSVPGYSLKTCDNFNDKSFWKAVCFNSMCVFQLCKIQKN